MKAQKNFIILLSLLILLTGVYACDGDLPPESTGVPAVTMTKQDITSLMQSMDIQHVSDSVEMPDITLPSIDGELVSLNQFRGKVVLLSFWATW